MCDQQAVADILGQEVRVLEALRFHLKVFHPFRPLDHFIQQFYATDEFTFAEDFPAVCTSHLWLMYTESDLPLCYSPAQLALVAVLFQFHRMLQEGDEDMAAASLSDTGDMHLIKSLECFCAPDSPQYQSLLLLVRRCSDELTRIDAARVQPAVSMMSTSAAAGSSLSVAAEMARDAGTATLLGKLTTLATIDAQRRAARCCFVSVSRIDRLRVLTYRFVFRQLICVVGS